jgi:hypothetical protein
MRYSNYCEGATAKNGKRKTSRFIVNVIKIFVHDNKSVLHGSIVWKCPTAAGPVRNNSSGKHNNNSNQWHAEYRSKSVLLNGGDIAPQWAVKQYRETVSSFRAIGGWSARFGRLGGGELFFRSMQRTKIYLQLFSFYRFPK